MWTRIALLIVACGLVAPVSQTAAQSQVAANRSVPSPAARAMPAPPADYVIGPDDRLSIVFWRAPEMSAEVMVRPDGRISLPLLNDVDAAGFTPEQLRERLVAEAARFIKEPPAATVVVMEINSRRVFITGQVEKPGAYPLNGTTTVLQLIATAGGLREFVGGKDIVIVRQGNLRLEFNYQDVVKGKNLHQNIQLRPGDTVIVP